MTKNKKPRVVINKHINAALAMIRKANINMSFKYLDAWATKYQVMKKKQVVRITLEFPIESISGIEELSNFNVLRDTKMKVIPMLAVFENGSDEDRTNNTGATNA